MNIKQIRNVTIIITYAGKKFLVDPMLAPKGLYPGIMGTPNSHLSNPLVELPVSLDEITNVDAIIVTHIHFDHIDEVALKVLPKNLKTFVQDEKEAIEMREFGFTDVEVLTTNNMFDDIKLIKTSGIHGEDETVINFFKEANLSHNVCGIIFNHENEDTLYLAGDTVWCDEVKESIETYNPDVIILNAGDAQFSNGKSLIMGKNDVYEVCKVAPMSTVIASHMEAVNHATLSRKELREFANKNNLSNLLIPLDGESYDFK